MQIEIVELYRTANCFQSNQISKILPKFPAHQPELILIINPANVVSTEIHTVFLLLQIKMAHWVVGDQ